MIVFRSRRVRTRKPGLTDREIADALAPHGDVDFAPVEPPVDAGGPIEPPRDPVVEWHRGGGDAA